MNFVQAQFFEQIQSWLAVGNNVNAYRTEQGWTLLHLAAEYRDVRAIESLVRMGLSPDIPDKAGWTALHLAVDADLDSSSQGNVSDLKAVGALIKVGANRYATDLEGKTPRDIASGYGAEALAAYDRIV